VKSNEKVQSDRSNALANSDTSMRTWGMRFAFLLLLTSVYFLGNLQPAVGDRRSGDEGSGVGGTGILELPGSGLGGSGMRPFLGFDQRIPSEVIVVREPALPRDTMMSTAIATESGIERVLDKLEPATQAVTQKITQAATPKMNEPDGRRIEGFLQPNLSSLITNGSAESASSLSILESIENGTEQINVLLAISAGELGMPEAGIAKDEIEPASVRWVDIANWLNATALAEQGKTVEQPSTVAKNTKDGVAIAEVTRATALRRPQLPPLQRARPLQRATILPPRVRPLGL
jgi:hypothetical protein